MPNQSALLPFSDSHCHLDWFDQAADIAAQAATVGVSSIIVPAVGVNNFEAVKQSALLGGVFAAYGLHPLYQAEHQPEHLEQLEAYLQHENPIAIGECGLDYSEHASHHQEQLDTFIFQLKLAKRFDLPVLLHARQSLDAVLYQLKRHAIKRFVIHSFTGSDQQLQRIFELDGYIGIGGTSTYPRATRLQRQLANIPSDRYLLETDAPDQPLCGRQGITNTPDQIPTIAQNLATLRHVPLETISQQSQRNMNQFFNHTF